MLLSIAVLGGSWVGLFTFMSASAAAGSWQTLDEAFIPEIDASELILPDLSRPSRIYSSDGTQLAILHDGRISEPAPFDEIPLQMIYAILAAEDGDFFEHEGIDIGSIAAAARANLLFGTTRGGSTITQQVVKLHFVGDELSYARKIKEALTAIELERRYPKEQILEFYMNSVYFGYGAYGVKAAAREYFDKDLADISVAEAATIAVIVRNPAAYNPRRNPEDALVKRDAVIDLMLRDGWITQAVADIALNEPLRVVDHKVEVPLAEHVVAEVRRSLLDLNNDQFDFLGTTFDERKKAIFGCPADDTTCTGGGGLAIHTTIDLGLQTTAQEILQEWMPTPEDPTESAPTGAIAMVDNWTGAVRVMASGLPFEREQFDLATQGRRNPGSSFKPIAMMAALENDMTLGSFWNATSPYEFKCPDVCFPSGTWRVTNAGAGSGLMRLDEATYRSVNVVYAGLALELGPEHIVDTAHRMGITADLEAVPSISLGGSAVSPLEMASAYTTFATNGVHADSYLVERIDHAERGNLYEHRVRPRQVFPPAMAAAGRQPLLRVPTSSGTARNANIGVPQGGKTGTHSGNRDVWYVGFVPNYSAAVWVGYPDEQKQLTNVTIRGERYSRLFGGTVPGPIWAQFMRAVLENEDPGEFPADPGGIGEYFKVPSTQVPDVMALTGTNPEALATEVTRLLHESHLNANVELVPSLEPAGTILSVSHPAGTTVAQGTAIVVEISTGVPATAPLPNLVGSTIPQVDSTLAGFAEEHRVTLTYTIRFVDTWNPGEVDRVISSSPGAGATVTDGDSITLNVGRQGSGPPPGDD